jgi:hypothetical protein
LLPFGITTVVIFPVSKTQFFGSGVLVEGVRVRVLVGEILVGVLDGVLEGVGSRVEVLVAVTVGMSVGVGVATTYSI